MDLQNTFYILGIVCMSLFIVLLLVIIGMLLYIQRKISLLSELVQLKVDAVKEAITNPGEIALTVGTAVAGKALNQVSKLFKKH